MFDFPASPTIGQVVTGGNGAAYQWDGVSWGPSSTVTGTTINNVGRNLIHNSMFNVQQRGAGPWAVNLNFTADRWGLRFTTDTVSASLVSLTDADRTAIGDEQATTALSVTTTGSAAAGAFSAFRQLLEGIRRFGNRTITLSFWAKSSAARQVGISLVQGFGTGGSPSAGAVTNAPDLVAITTSWARYSITVTLPSIVGKTLGTNSDDNLNLGFWLSTGSGTTAPPGLPTQSGTFQFWGIQLEYGNVATPLEKLDIRNDLANCQRFYQVGYASWSGYGAAGSPIGCAINLPVSMRAAPTIAFNGQSYTNASNLITAATLSYIFIPQATATATGAAVFNGGYTASADL